MDDTDQLDRIKQADALFFERHPDRRHRLRLAGHSEVRQQWQVLDENDPIIPDGQRLFCAVKDLGHGVRMRVMLLADDAIDFDLNEDDARRLFNRHRDFAAVRAEKVVRKWLARSGGQARA